MTSPTWAPWLTGEQKVKGENPDLNWPEADLRRLNYTFTKRLQKLMVKLWTLQIQSEIGLLPFISMSVVWFAYYCCEYNSLVKANMVSTRKKEQLHTRRLRQLDGFDQDVIIDNAANSGQQDVVVNDSAIGQEYTAYNIGSNLVANEISVNAQTLESCFNESIDKEMGNIVDKVEHRIQNSILTALNVITPVLS